MFFVESCPHKLYYFAKTNIYNHWSENSNGLKTGLNPCGYLLAGTVEV
jgi:hypothetical protein